MQIRHMTLFAGVLVLAGVAMRAQQTAPQATPEPAPVMRTETRLVLVDTVVTDKKGNYIRDLTSKEFKVWEDNKEVTVKNFSFEADPAAANAQKRYLILFFDNSTMDPGDQIRARDAAGKFIDSNAGPNRLMAVVNFGGSLRIAQNFTADADRLKKVVSGVKFSAVSPNSPADVTAAAGFPSLRSAASDFGAHSVMLALRSMAKNLASVPGRKTLILFSSGFPLTPEYQSELTAVIDSCNKANVAVYPIDVRGLIAGGPAAALETPSGYPSARLLRASYAGGSTPFRLGSFGSSFVPQHAGAPGGGAGGGAGAGAGGARPGGPAGGGTTGGGTAGGGKGGGTTGGAPGGGKGGGTTGGTGGGKGGGNNGGGGNPGGGRGTGGYGNGRGSMPGQPYANNPYNLSRQSLVPRFPESASTNQQVLYSLAEGTGGFVIANTNDLLGGLEKIGKEQNEFYILAYAPTDSPEGSCHTLRVKVDRGGTNVRARSGYCNAKPVDLLAGDPAGKDLENRAKGTQPGTVTAAMRVPFFYTGENIARVNIAMEISSEGIQFEKVKKRFHSAVNVLGIAYRADNTVAARFSDTVKLDMENKKELEAFHETPLHYENQFEVASGTYTLKVVFSSGGESFGKLEAPLVIEPYDGKQFSMSGLALSKDVHRVSDLEAGLDAELLEGRTPLMTQGLQVTPTGASRFKTTDPSAIYVEIYEPLLAGPNPPEVGLQLRVLDRKSGEQKQDTGIMSVANSIRPDNPVIPVGVKLPVATLAPGAYRVELKAVDAAGRSSALRTADFEVE